MKKCMIFSIRMSVAGSGAPSLFGIDALGVVGSDENVATIILLVNADIGCTVSYSPDGVRQVG